jgi:hypothetical protein
MEPTKWIKSGRSDNSGPYCVEVGATVAGVAMRDSKDPDGPRLHYTTAEFRAFVQGAKDGDFDHLT